MNTKQLKYVIVLAREGSFSKAAESLGITQPSLSQYVKKIEKEIGLELFDRTGGNLRLTDAGRVYIDAGQKILERFPVDEAHSATERLRQFMGYSFLATPGLKLFADRMSEAGMKVWGYNFNYVSAENAKAGLGAPHAEEMAYIFRTHSGAVNEDQKRLTDEMHNRFVNFIKTGDPNGELSTPSGADWPQYKTNGALLQFDKEVKAVDFPGLEDMNFMQEVLYGKD